MAKNHRGRTEHPPVVDLYPKSPWKLFLNPNRFRVNCIGRAMSLFWPSWSKFNFLFLNWNFRYLLRLKKVLYAPAWGPVCVAAWHQGAINVAPSVGQFVKSKPYSLFWIYPPQCWLQPIVCCTSGRFCQEPIHIPAGKNMVSNILVT